MKIKMYCATVAGQANQPGQSVKNVRLQGIQDIVSEVDKKVTPSPNAAHFKEGKGNVNIDLINLSLAAVGEFEEGATYTVTITQD